MKRSTMVAIDRLFFPVFYLFKKVKCMVPKKDQPAHQFLIIKFFGLGSLARIAHVLEQCPETKSKVVFLTLKKNAPLLEALDLKASYVNSRSFFTLLGTTFRQVFSIWRQNTLSILDMERSSNLAGIIGMTAAIGKPYRAFHFKSGNKTVAGQKWISLEDKSTIEAIAEMLAIPLDHHQTKKSSTGNSIQRIGININAGDYLPERKFPIDQWVLLCQELAQSFPQSTFFLTGLEAEKNYVQQFEKKWTATGEKINVKNLTGSQNLNAFLSHLASLDLFITNDSGPLHLAQLKKIKTVAIWGPTSAKQVGYPNNDSMLNLSTKIACHPCFIHPKSKVAKACKGKLTCFKEMDPFEMAERIRTFTQ
jgi:hypothetical protein